MGDQLAQTDTKRSTTKQVILSLLTNFSTISPSMSIGFSAVAIPVFEKELSKMQISWFASIASLATPFGCFFSGPVADRFGRRIALSLVNTVCFFGWIGIAVACYFDGNTFTLLILGRILTGFSTGLCSSPATIYMSEVASSELRSVFTVWATIFFSLGVLVIYVLGLLFKEKLVLMSLIAAALPCIGIIFTIFLIPESPPWLLEKNRINEARLNMYKIFGSKQYDPIIESEIEVRLKNCGFQTKKEKTFQKQFVSKIRYLLQPYILKPLLIVLTFFFFQQMTGIFAILFYALDIVKNAGITFDSYTTIVVIALIRIIAAILASIASKKIGRRPLSILSGSCMAVCLLGLVGFLYWKESAHNYNKSMNLVPYVLIMLYFFTSCIGFLPFPFALSAELFPTKIKGLMSGLCSGIGYFFNFIAVKMYPMMEEQMGSRGIFLFYGVISLFGTIFLACFLPETKGKSLKEIQKYFGKIEEEQENAEKLLMNATAKNAN